MAVVVPSILSADFVNLAAEIRAVTRAGASMLHIDVMDGHFVPNLTVGLPVLKSIRRSTDALLDVHLMISNPDQMAEAYAEAGADFVTFHYETAYHTDRLLEAIRAKGARAGIVLNPHSPVHLLEEILPKCDTVLLMSVNPGFGGQKFIPNSLEKVQKLRALAKARRLGLQIEIDGGIDEGNIASVVRAGADLLVIGSAIFDSRDPGEKFREMQRLGEEEKNQLKAG